jgi:hypothetical protein
MQRLNQKGGTLMKRSTALSAIGAIITSAALMAGPLPASDSGLVTLLPNQVAVLNVVNIDPSASCKINMSLIDSAGNVLTSLITDPAIASGGSAFPLAFEANVHVSLRAHLDYSPQLIEQAGLKDPMAGCYNLLPTLEVMRIADGVAVILDNFVGMPSSTGSGAMKIDVCHNYTKNNPHTINISTSAWKAHQGHGDILGPCPTN